MTFTYDPSLGTELDQLRLAIGDTVDETLNPKSGGPRPRGGNTNYPNETLNAILTQVSGEDHSFVRAKIVMFKALEAEWRIHASVNAEDKFSYSAISVANGYQNMYKQLEDEISVGSGFAGFVTVERKDQWNEGDSTDEFS